MVLKQQPAEDSGEAIILPEGRILHGKPQGYCCVPARVISMANEVRKSIVPPPIYISPGAPCPPITPPPTLSEPATTVEPDAAQRQQAKDEDYVETAGRMDDADRKRKIGRRQQDTKTRRLIHKLPH